MRPLVEEIIYTMLSQNTSDVNSLKAFDNLRSTVGNWDDLLLMQPSQIALAIKVGGLSKVKAPRIKEILLKLTDRFGTLDKVSFAGWSKSDIIEYLTAMRGIGLKSAACIMLFGASISAFPVDTHIFRVSKRLGIIPMDSTTEYAHDLFDKAIPDAQKYDLHILMIKHGRVCCKAIKPACTRCGLTGFCYYFTQT